METNQNETNQIVTSTNRYEIAIEKLKIHQDFYYALIGGLLAAFICAIIWAIITVISKYQIGYMAIGVGLAVGFTVQFFGAGIDKKFGFLGASLSLIGCILGNLFSQVGFIAQNESLGYLETLTYLNFGLIVNILVESFNPMDVLFYGIAIYEGYKFAFRSISDEDIKNLQSEEFQGHPANYKLRMPLVIGSIIILALVVLRLNMGVSGMKTYKYESGNIMSEGELKNSHKTGKWIYYYENGNVQSTGFYDNDLPDSSWQWFYEDGKQSKIGKYRKGLENGLWLIYYNNGIVSDSGGFLDSRMAGEWVYKYENGNISQQGFYKRNVQDSIWKTYYEDGHLNSIGKMKDGKPIGKWMSYFNNGQLADEMEYNNNKVHISNSWDIKGKQQVLNGNGLFKSFSTSGQLLLFGEIKEGAKVGKWVSYYEDGKIKEEGNFENEVYLILNSWDFQDNQIVKDGSGIYCSYYSDGKSKYETGEIKNGLRNGIWKMFFESTDTPLQEVIYIEGKLTGTQKYFYQSGNLYSSGEMMNDMREGEWNWFNEDGSISSSVSFIHDKKQGKQIICSETGEITREEFYENGELVEENSI